MRGFNRYIVVFRVSRLTHSFITTTHTTRQLPQFAINRRVPASAPRAGLSAQLFITLSNINKNATLIHVAALTVIIAIILHDTSMYLQLIMWTHVIIVFTNISCIQGSTSPVFSDLLCKVNTYVMCFLD